jgi:hypothetical protein
MVGHASQVNALSVPPSWTVTTATDIQPATDPLSEIGTASDVSAQTPGVPVFGETLLGTLAGRAIAAGTAARPRANPVNRVIPRSPAGG